MSHEVVCDTCGGTGKVTVYEPWERALLVNDGLIALAERDREAWELADIEPRLAPIVRARHIVSLDVEGSYPAALLVEAFEDDIEVVERTLSLWPMHGNDVYTHPLNARDGVYTPVDPRFYEVTT